MRSHVSDQTAPTDSTTGSAIIVNAWVVADGYQEEFVETLVRLFEHVRTLDGFIEGEFLRGANPTRFVSYVRMRSARDRQRLLDDSEVSALLRAAEQIARPDLHSYDVLRGFGPRSRSDVDPEKSRPSTGVSAQNPLGSDRSIASMTEKAQAPLAAMRSKDAVIGALRRAGVAPETIAVLQRQLPDQVDLGRDGNLLAAHGITMDRLGDRLGASP
jgi:heme-degrading monooxygenase HmoA